jgi:serine phosphatase RsbU (regulator of sigma subunit)
MAKPLRFCLILSEHLRNHYVSPLLHDSAGAWMLDLGGLPLGTPLSDRTLYAEQILQLAPGDLLVLSTDGIVEAANM